MVPASDDKTIKFWDPFNDYKYLNILQGNYESVSSVIQLNLSTIFSTGNDRTVKTCE